MQVRNGWAVELRTWLVEYAGGVPFVHTHDGRCLCVMAEPVVDWLVGWVKGMGRQ